MNKKALSPVIATIIMVTITVVLSGILVLYLQTLPMDELQSSQRTTYTGVVTDIEYNQKTTSTGIGNTRLELNNETVIYISGVVNGVTMGDNYRIIVEKQVGSGFEYPYKLISIKKMGG